MTPLFAIVCLSVFGVAFVLTKAICGILVPRCKRKCPHVSATLKFGTPKIRN